MKGKIKDILEKSRKSKTEEDYLREESETIPDNYSKGVKLDNNKSQIKKQAPPLDIKKNAYKIINDNEEQKRIAWELTSRLLALFKDKTLNENKDATMREEESNVLADYIEFARIINTSPNEEDSLGSISFIVALARCMLIQRDSINELHREIFLLRKQIDSQKTNS